MKKHEYIQEYPTTKGQTFMGMFGGFVFGFIIGFILGFLILKIIGSKGTYDGLLVVYTAWGGAIIGVIIGFISPQFIGEAIGKTIIGVVILSIPAYLFFLFSIRDVRDIDKDQFKVKGELALLKKIQVNVRYKISENENPVYSIFYHTRNYLDDESNKNNIQASQYVFFVNYDNKLFTTFIKNDAQNCQKTSLLNRIGLGSSHSPSKCWDEDMLHFIQDKENVYVGCTMIGDKHCIKLAPLVTLEGTAKIPDEYTKWKSIGRREIEDNREQRSFWSFIVKFLVG